MMSKKRGMSIDYGTLQKETNKHNTHIDNYVIFAWRKKRSKTYITIYGNGTTHKYTQIDTHTHT